VSSYLREHARAGLPYFLRGQPDRLCYGDRTLETWRLEDRHAYGVRISQAPRRLAVLPGFAVEHPAVEVRGALDSALMDKPSFLAKVEQLATYLDGYERSTALDVALWRGNE
jgi:hypothetical protein